MSARHCLNDLPACLFWVGNRRRAPHFEEALLTDILNAVSPLINVNLQSDQFFLDSIFFVVFLLVVGRLFRNIGKCGKACLPEEDAFKI